MKFNNKRNGITLSYIYLIINTILTVFISAFILRTVGKTNHGVYQSMTAFASYLVLLEFGTGTIMRRNISMLKKNKDDNYLIDKNISTIWSLTLILSIIIIGIAISFYFLIDKIYVNSMTYEQIVLGKKLFIFAIITLIFSFLNTTLNGLLIAFEQYVFEKILNTIRLIVRTILIIAFLTIKPDIYYLGLIDAVLIIICFAITLVFVLVKYKIRITFKYFDFGILKASIPLALATLLQGLVNTANGVADKFLISIMMTPDDVSIYAISMNIFTLFSSIGSIPISMFMPGIAKCIQEGNEGKQLTKKLVGPSRLNVIILGVILFGFALVGKQFIIIVYGADFSDSWIYAMIVIIPMYFNMFNSVIINVLDIYNKRLIRSLLILGATTINIIITIIGLKYFGIIGAVAGITVSLILQTIISNVYYHKKIKIDIPFLFRESFKGIFIYLVIAFIVSFPLMFIIKSKLLQLLICGSVFVIVFFLLFVIFGINEEEKRIVSNFIYSLKNRKNKKNN